MTTSLVPTDTALSIDPDERITRAEAMARLGISSTTLTRYFERGTLTPIRATVGRRTFLSAGEVERVRRGRLALDS
jgi:predicted site-specific integrase-resolvase